MEARLKELLARFKKSTITIDELSLLLHDQHLQYEAFARLILSFEESGILKMIRASGRNPRTPSIAYRYRIRKHLLKENEHIELRNYQLTFHPAIKLDDYYSLPKERWDKDLPYLTLLDTYIKTYDFPDDFVPAPERSVRLVQDEKWISEKGGKDLLERVHLWAKMNVIPVSDPLMMAVNPIQLIGSDHLHLIVENKTTYQALLSSLNETVFSTLIYGCGNKIVKSIEQLEWQLPLPNARHHYYYFGDIDRSGITIWDRLTKKVPVQLALPFYHSCLGKKPLKGKENQPYNEEAMNHFIESFTKKGEHSIRTQLNQGFYYPQEILNTAELKMIWRDWSCTLMNGTK